MASPILRALDAEGPKIEKKNSIFGPLERGGVCFLFPVNLVSVVPESPGIEKIRSRRLRRWKIRAIDRGLKFSIEPCSVPLSAPKSIPGRNYIPPPPISGQMVTCYFPHLPVVNKFLRFWPSQTDWNWLKLIKTDWSWLKLIEKDRKSIEMDWKSTRIWGTTIEIAENELRRFRMEGGVKKHLKMAFSRERGGGGVYFEAPRGRNFIRSPLLCTPVVKIASEQQCAILVHSVLQLTQKLKRSETIWFTNELLSELRKRKRKWNSGRKSMWTWMRKVICPIKINTKAKANKYFRGINFTLISVSTVTPGGPRT